MASLRLSICLLLAASSALAEGVDVSLVPTAQKGQGYPAVQVRILDAIAGYELKLQRSDGKAVTAKGRGAPGTVKSIPLEQPEGTFTYQGELAVMFMNGETSTMPLKFEASLLGALELRVDKSDVDVAARKLRFFTSRPAKKARVTVLMDTGQLAYDDEVIFDADDAAKPLEIAWPEKPGRVLKIALQAFDAQSFFTGVELFPWQVDIPHEEVTFDTGKWDIRPGERAKLDASYALITDAVRKYGKLADIKLYVAGHTDTVGGGESNRELSLQRARSIGAYFKKRGVRVQIYYDGLGEEALAVPTPDEKDEARNRRAEYIVAVEPPVVHNARAQPSWRKL